MNGGAVFNYTTIVPLTISNSKFTGNIASDNKGNAISNDGLLVLSNNEINTESADIYSDEGLIQSEMNVVILDNETVTLNGAILLTAKIVDDNNNLIEETKFTFIVNGTELTAEYNKTSGFYEAEYVNDQSGIYLVNITYVNGEDENVTVKTATLINIKGTFTDLQQLIDAGNPDLQYDFAYVDVIDGDNFIDGVVIDKSTMTIINGNGHKIDAKQYNRIFNIKEDNIVVLNNLTLVNGIADEGCCYLFI